MLTSSYGLGIPDYGDDSEMAGAVSDAGSQHHHHGHHHGLGDSGHCIGSYHGGSDHYNDTPSHQHQSSSSPFADVIPDTFHAEFITQPIDYPMGVSPPPAPPSLTLIPRGPHTPSSAGSPTQISCSPASSPISPSHTLPSFLDTYSVGSSVIGGPNPGRHHVLETMSPHTPQPTTLEPRFTFKTEPVTSVCETVATPSPSSSYASHYQVLFNFRFSFDTLLRRKAVGFEVLQ